MGDEQPGGIHIVAATRDGRTEYWAAATIRANAVDAVRQQIVALTERRLTPEKVAELKMRPNSVRQLGVML